MDKTKRKYRLSRLFKNRKVRVEETVEEDLKWFWAAYRKGAWEGVLDDGLTQQEFVDKLSEGILSVSGLYTVFNDDKVVGVVTVVDDLFSDELYQKPTLSWFPWASARDRVGGAARVILKLREKAPLFIQIPENESKFVTHLAKYGILRRVGKLSQGDSQVFLLESVRKS